MSDNLLNIPKNVTPVTKVTFLQRFTGRRNIAKEGLGTTPKHRWRPARQLQRSQCHSKHRSTATRSAPRLAVLCMLLLLPGSEAADPEHASPAEPQPVWKICLGQLGGNRQEAEEIAGLLQEVSSSIQVGGSHALLLHFMLCLGADNYTGVVTAALMPPAATPTMPAAHTHPPLSRSLR